MPPKCRFTKEEIIQAALEITRNEGFSAITARALGTKLGTSPKPIFSVFANMEEVQQEVIKTARRVYKEYVQEGLSETLSFRGAGSQYIHFAITEPKLFQLLFMSEQENIPKLSEVLPLIDESYEKILFSIEHDYSLSGAAAQKLYQHLWIYSHGIATLCATNMCRFTGEEIGEMLAEICLSLIKKMKVREEND